MPRFGFVPDLARALTWCVSCDAVDVEQRLCSERRASPPNGSVIRIDTLAHPGSASGRRHRTMQRSADTLQVIAYVADGGLLDELALGHGRASGREFAGAL